MKQRLYECDPNKNIECSKSNCVHNPKTDMPMCSHTTKKKYAKVPPVK